MANNTLNSIFQSAATKFAADRDDAISKINRALECDNPEIDIENIIYDNISKLAHAKMCIQTIQEELALMNEEQNKKKL